MYSYEKQTASRVRVAKDGEFMCFLIREYRRAATSGFSPAHYVWTALLEGGIHISSPSLRTAKKKIEGKVDRVTGRPLKEFQNA